MTSIHHDLPPVRCWTCGKMLEPIVRGIYGRLGNIDAEVRGRVAQALEEEGKDVYDSDMEDEDTGINFWDSMLQEVMKRELDNAGLKRFCCRRVCVSYCATPPGFHASVGNYVTRSNMYSKPPTRHVRKVYKVSEC